jgi:hypothetical protein
VNRRSTSSPEHEEGGMTKAGPEAPPEPHETSDQGQTRQ